MAEQSSYLSSYYSNQDYVYTGQGSVEDYLDDYFVSNLAKESDYTFMPKSYDYRSGGEDFMQATRLNTDATTNSEPTSPYYDVQNSAKQQEENQYLYHQVSGAGTNMKISYESTKSVSINFSRQYKKSEEIEEESEDELELPKNSSPWDEEKDEMLLKLGAQFKCDWKKIAKKLNNKKMTPHVIKMRYKELTDAATTKRIKFNHREDLMIAKYFDKFGSNWAKMAEFFPDRTPIMLKNRYYSFIRKRELLDLLMNKVREIENGDGMTVDRLHTAESERYTECMDLQRESSFKEPLVEQRVCVPLDFSKQKHIVFGYEGVKPAILYGQTASVVFKDQEKEKEIKILKDRVKSLQTLYLQTRAELNKYKNKK